MSENLPAPLGGRAPPEVPLVISPLERVVMQVQFSTVLKIEDRDGITALQEEVRGAYPLFEHSTSHQLQFDPNSPATALRPTVNNIWQFTDATKSFRIALGSESVSMEAMRYASRSDFLARWSDVLEKIERLFSPGLCTRSGARYVNRLSGKALERLTELVTPNFIGVAQPELRTHVVQALSQAVLTVEEGALLLRWGVLAPGTTIDPGLLPAINVPSWILDIDVHSAVQRSFSAEELSSDFARLSERAYALFRYSMTDDALRFFGVSDE